MDILVWLFCVFVLDPLKPSDTLPHYKVSLHRETWWKTKTSKRMQVSLRAMTSAFYVAAIFWQDTEYFTKISSSLCIFFFKWLHVFHGRHPEVFMLFSSLLKHSLRGTVALLCGTSTWLTLYGITETGRELGGVSTATFFNRSKKLCSLKSSILMQTWKQEQKIQVQLLVIVCGLLEASILKIVNIYQDKSLEKL